MLTERDRRQPRGWWPSQASCSIVISSCPSTKSWEAETLLTPLHWGPPGQRIPRTGAHCPGLCSCHPPAPGCRHRRPGRRSAGGRRWCSGGPPALCTPPDTGPGCRASARPDTCCGHRRGHWAHRAGNTTATAPPSMPGTDAQALAPHPKTQDMMDIRPICRVQPWWAQGPQPSGAGSGPRTLASLTTGCSAGGWSGPGRSAGDGGGRGRRLGGHRAPHPHRAPAHTRSRRRSPGGTARPRRCPRPRSWRGRRTRSPRTAAPRRTPALPGQMPRSAPVAQHRWAQHLLRGAHTGLWGARDQGAQAEILGVHTASRCMQKPVGCTQVRGVRD